MAQKTTINIRVGMEELGRWKEQAVAEGVGVSEWIRRRANQGRGEDMPKPKTEEVEKGELAPKMDAQFVDVTVSRRMGHPVGCTCVHCGKVRAMLMPKVNK